MGQVIEGKDQLWHHVHTEAMWGRWEDGALNLTRSWVLKIPVRVTKNFIPMVSIII